MLTSTSRRQNSDFAAAYVHADVSKAADSDAMVAAAKSEFGRLDVLVNNASYCHAVKPFWELSEEEYDGVDIAECGMEAYPEFTQSK